MEEARERGESVSTNDSVGRLRLGTLNQRRDSSELSTSEQASHKRGTHQNVSSFDVKMAESRLERE